MSSTPKDKTEPMCAQDHLGQKNVVYNFTCRFKITSFMKACRATRRWGAQEVGQARQDRQSPNQSRRERSSKRETPSLTRSATEKTLLHKPRKAQRPQGRKLAAARRPRQGSRQSSNWDGMQVPSALRTNSTTQSTRKHYSRAKGSSPPRTNSMQCSSLEILQLP